MLGPVFEEQGIIAPAAEEQFGRDHESIINVAAGGLAWIFGYINNSWFQTDRRWAMTKVLEC